tara:strand:+ start:609 stop:758 length:150 start_codon:yes stop_codon:yes gene_type:complete
MPSLRPPTSCDALADACLSGGGVSAVLTALAITRGGVHWRDAAASTAAA